MNQSNKLLSDITSFRTYAKHLPHLGRRESLEETINRSMQMDLEKFPKLSKELIRAYAQVHDLSVMPSMRKVQFAGEAILKNNVRSYNCSFVSLDNPKAFSESLFLLLSGVGVGYSVQRENIKQLPKVQFPGEDGIFIVHDSIQGWAQCVELLMNSYFYNQIRPVFDFSHIRSKGSYLVTSGSKAPGPEPLKKMLKQVEDILKSALGRKLKTIEAHDLMCIISDCVLAGGIRRSALISLFDSDDQDMLKCKSGQWWEKSPWRARANNSAVLVRGVTTKEEFMYVYNMCRNSGAGEPGFKWTNNPKLGTNPCKPLNSVILTPEGYITYKQALEMDSLMVVRPDGKFSEASKPFKTGTKSVTKILLSNGQYLYGTQDHKHKLNDGTWVEIKDFKVGDRLEYSVNKVNDFNIKDKTTHEDGLLAGWIWADGWSFERENGTSYRTGICFGSNKQSAIPLFEKITGKKSEPHSQSGEVRNIKLNSDPNGIYKKYSIDKDKSNLEWLYQTNSDFKLGFLNAAFSADGSVRKANNVELYSVNRETLEVLSNVLKEFGIHSTIVIHNYAKSYVAKDNKVRNNKDCWKLNVFSGQFKLIGLVSAEKQTLLDKHVKTPIFRRKDYVTIKSITHDNSFEDVYDITVYDDDHAYVDNGVTTHNCGEIALNSMQFCNLTTINASTVTDERSFYKRIKAAAVLGTVQAAYTSFPYLREQWQYNTENEALLGVSMTGIADSYGILTDEMLIKGGQLVLETNLEISRKLGINPAARATCLKPEGSASCVLGSSSGIHDRHAQNYIRRIRMNKDDALYSYLQATIPELCEDDLFGSNGGIVSIPQEAPEGALLRDNTSASDLFKRAQRFNNLWVANGHRSGDDMHNVSVTISVREEEWATLGEDLWKNRKSYNGVSLLPFDNGSYKQAPFETCTKEQFEEMNKLVKNIDLRQVMESEDMTIRNELIACAGGVCSIE